MHAVRIVQSIYLSVLLAFLVAVTPAAAQASASPTATVERLNATLMQIMQNADRLGYKGRYDTLAPVLAESFNFPVMARISIGKHWKALSPEQKKQFTQAFARLSVATFAYRFDGYGGEKFQVRGEKNQRKDTILVDNVLLPASGDAVGLNYIVRQFNGRWRIIDIQLDAKYSELALKRSEYSSVLEKDGFETLIASMEEKIAGYAAGS